MKTKSELWRLEQLKFKDDAVVYREREAALSALNFSTFITAIGPLWIVLLKAVKGLPVGPLTSFLILGTAPLGILLTLINWARTPQDYRRSKPVLRAVMLAGAAALATFVLAGYWGLRKAGTP